MLNPHFSIATSAEEVNSLYRVVLSTWRWMMMKTHEAAMDDVLLSNQSGGQERSSPVPPVDDRRGAYGALLSPRGNTMHDGRHIGDIHVLTWTERVQSFLDSTLGIALETFNVLLSMILVIQAVVESYETGTLNKEANSFSSFEIFSTFVFALDYGLHLFAAEERLKFMFTPMGIIDVITIAPFLITYFLASLSLGILPLVRVARVFRMLAILRLFRIVQSYHGFDYQLAVLIFMIFALIFVAGGVFQVLEESYYSSIDSKLQFHQAIYFIFVTISTVGYGDISPKNTASQLFVIFIIIVIVTVIPPQLNRLLELSKLQHDYMHSYAVRKRSIHNGGHVIVAGSLTVETVSEFLSEFYRLRQGRVNMDVVFLADQLPSERLKALLLNVKYRRRATYLKGSLLNERDAKRVHVETAAAVFILAEKGNPKHSESTDAFTILQALAVDKFRFRSKLQASNHGNRKRQRDIRCFLQIVSTQRTRGLRTMTGVEVALNTSHLRTAILARGIVCPGVTALILNLIYSAPEHEIETAKKSNVPWIAEYASGLQQKLFPVFLSKYFEGLKFEQAAEKLYRNFHIIFIAVYNKCAVNHGRKRVCLSPFNQILREDDIGFFIAPSASMAKHAVDNLMQHDQQKDSFPVHSLPMLVFSCENVLGRQSFSKGRSRSLLFVEEESDIDELCSLSRPTSLPFTAFSNNNFGNTHSTTAVCTEASSTSRSSSLEPLSSELSPSAAPEPTLSRLNRQQRSALSGTFRHADSILRSHTRRHLSGHVIICGPFVHGHQIACYLDRLYLKEQNTVLGQQSARPVILLLVKSFPSNDDYDNLPCPLPENVFVEKGFSQNIEDLLRVRAYEAKSVLMIPGNWKYHADEFHEENMQTLSNHLMDYQVIMSTLSLRTMQELHNECFLRAASIDTNDGSSISLLHQSTTLSCSVVRSHDSIHYFAYKSNKDDYKHHSSVFNGRLKEQEAENLRHHQHRKFFHHRHEHHKVDDLMSNEAQILLPAAFAPSYAAGEIFVESVLDTLLCQSFFNPYVIDLIRALAGDYYSIRESCLEDSGNGNFNSSIMRYFSSRTTTTAEEESDTEGKDDKKDKGQAGVTNSASDSMMTAYCYPVVSFATITPELEGEPFEMVFQRALAQQVLVLSIYRRPNDPKRGNTLPYVFTCPDGAADYRVERGDCLHVLSKHPSPICIQ